MRTIIQRMGKMRIAAYCRVSTTKEEQVDSLEHQKEFFMEYAQKNGHELVQLYADEAVIIGLKPPSTNGRRFSPISITGHFPI